MKKLALVSAAVAALFFIGCDSKPADVAGNVTAAVEGNVTAVEGNATEAITAVEDNATVATGNVTAAVEGNVTAVEGNVTH